MTRRDPPSLTLRRIACYVGQNYGGQERRAKYKKIRGELGPKNNVFEGNQTTNDTIVRLGDAIKLIGH
jgi:hypothetical protein